MFWLFLAPLNLGILINILRHSRNKCYYFEHELLNFAVLITLTFGPIMLHAGTIDLYVEAPTLQSSSVAGTTTENFDEIPVGTYGISVSTTIGTYGGSSADPFQIISADQYGGAGGTGNYFAVGSETGTPGIDAVTLDLNSENNYLGFWWSAGQFSNTITLLQNGTALVTFTTAELLALLPNSVGTTVTAIDGAQYNTADYYGNPNNGGDTTEPSAYIDIIATELQFNQVEFSNPGNTGFESDSVAWQFWDSAHLYSAAKGLFAAPDTTGAGMRFRSMEPRGLRFISSCRAMKRRDPRGRPIPLPRRSFGREGSAVLPRRQR